MRSLFLVFLCLLVFALTSAQEASAALLTFTSNGELYWNVLSLTDGDDSAIEIKKIADDFSPRKDESVALLNDSGKVYVSYGEGKKVDITGYSEDIVEIEETDAPSKVVINATGSGFAIKQRGVVAETSFPIKINSPQNKLSIETATGERFLSVLPYEVVELLTSSTLVSSISGNKMNLIERAEGEVAYEVSGVKSVTLFRVFTVDVPVTVEVSATSGSVVNIDQPLWYSVVGFFLT